MLRYLIAWLVMLIVSVANGAVRDFTYGKYISELHAHQLSTLSGMVLLGAVIFSFVHLWPPASARQAMFIGLIWTLFTVAFEFIFFHFVAGRPWAELLANYDLLHGRIWVLLLAWIALAPYLFHRLRERAE
jgi:glucose-6-phosphate-specific signal transduction histidine kinase